MMTQYIVMSMIQDVLEHEPKSSCHLLYGSRSEKGIIFHNVLDDLAKKHEGQLSVSHTISQPTKVKARGIGGLLGKKSISWKGDTGRIDIAKVTDFLAKNPSYTKAQLYYICGPGTMISNVEDALFCLFLLIHYWISLRLGIYTHATARSSDTGLVCPSFSA